MRSVLFVFVLALLIAGSYAVASPFVALNGLRNALDSGDTQEIERRVDFPLLRQSIKDQLQTLVVKKVGGDSDDNPLAALATGVASMMIDPTLDALVTPSGLARLVSGEGHSLDRKSPNAPPSRTRRNLLSEARVVRDSFERVTVWVPNDFGNEIRLEMRRYGMTWKLTNVVIADPQP